MKETEATFWDAEHWRKDPVSQKAIAEIERLQARVAEEIASLESAIADVERLQSELNTALERVRYADQQLHYALDAKDWKLVEEARALLQGDKKE